MPNCPKCGTKLMVEVCLTGGCKGHYFPGDRCYCDAIDVHIELYCPGHSTTKRHRYCGYVQKIVPELTDKYALERWLTEHYKE